MSSGLVDCEPTDFCYVTGSSHWMQSAVFSLEVSTWIVLCWISNSWLQIRDASSRAICELQLSSEKDIRTYYFMLFVHGSYKCSEIVENSRDSSCDTRDNFVNFTSRIRFVDFSHTFKSDWPFNLADQTKDRKRQTDWRTDRLIHTARQIYKDGQTDGSTNRQTVRQTAL